MSATAPASPPGSRSVSGWWHVVAVAVLAGTAPVAAWAWFARDRMPPGDFAGYAAVVAGVRDALLHYGRVPAWCSTCFGGSTVFLSNLKEYLVVPLAVPLGAVLATKIMFLVARVLGGLALYALLVRLSGVPLAGLVAGWAYAFGACANHELEHFDVPVSGVLFPLVTLAAVEMARGRSRWWAPLLGLLVALQLDTSFVQAGVCLLVPALVLAFRPEGAADAVPVGRRAEDVAAALAVFLLFGASQVAWFASDLPHHFLLPPDLAAAQQTQFVEHSPFLYLNRETLLSPWLEAHHPPGLNLDLGDPYQAGRHYLGLVAIVVVAGGWLFARRDRSLRRWYGVGGLLFLVQYWLALGPRTLLWQVARSFSWLDAVEAAVHVGLTALAVGGAVLALVATVRGWIRWRGVWLGLALLAFVPGHSLFQMAAAVLPPLAAQRSPGHFFDLAPFAFYLLLGVGLAALGRATGRYAAPCLVALGLAIALDFWPSTASFELGTPLAPVRWMARRVAELPGEDGTLRVVTSPRYRPVEDLLVEGSHAGAAWGWVFWQAGRYWPTYVSVARRALSPADGPPLLEAADPLMALGRFRFLLHAPADYGLTPPWHVRAENAQFSLWERPSVAPMSQGFRVWVVAAGAPDTSELEWVAEALPRDVMVVSGGSRLADADPQVIDGAALVLADASALGDATSRARAARVADKLADPRSPRWAMEGWSRLGAVAPPIDVAYRRLAPEHVVLRADAGDAPALVWLSESYHPWWQARVDGTPVTLLRAGFTFMAVAVGPGTHRVDLRFRAPAVVMVADAVNRLAWIVLALGVPAAAVGALLRRRG